MDPTLQGVSSIFSHKLLIHLHNSYIDGISSELVREIGGLKGKNEVFGQVKQGNLTSLLALGPANGQIRLSPTGNAR